jgi:hypothetical protein
MAVADSGGEREKCGEPTTKGHPCRNDADSCTWNHGGENQTGRESLFGEATRTACIEAAKEGKSKSGCARAAGVSEGTLRNWLDTHDEFFRAFRRARGEGESLLIEEGRRADGETSFVKFLLASSFGYVKTDRAKVRR